MLRRIAAGVLAVLLTNAVFGKDVFLSVTGKARDHGFFTDARIVNPSFDKDITITARYLPEGNVDNRTVGTVTLTIPKRSMRVFDDAVVAIFGNVPELGAIRLTSNDEFVATQRIYQDARQAPQGGTLGQFVPGLELTAAKKKGILPQLKVGEATLGNFRTNWGGLNPNAVVANIAFTLYDKNNAAVGTANLTLQPFGVFSPTDVVAFFGHPSSDLTESWISFDSDQPVFLYASVIDNGSSDPTFIAAESDAGVVAPPQPKTVDIRAINWQFITTIPEPLRAGDQVSIVVRATEGSHGFQMFSPSGNSVISISAVTNTQRELTLEAGEYQFFCTQPSCGVGHSSMSGSFTVVP